MARSDIAVRKSIPPDDRDTRSASAAPSVTFDHFMKPGPSPNSLLQLPCCNPFGFIQDMYRALDIK
jgi:hypothetical protein